MEKIVVGVDGSAASSSALAWVVDRCSTRTAEVEVVHVGPVAGRTASPHDALAEAERAMRAAAPEQAATFRRVSGAVAETLAEASAGADLLVIGVDPEHPVRAALGGWLPVRIIAHARSPLCIVPSGWERRQGSVTVGLEDDLSSSEALTFAAQEAERSSGRLRIVHAWHLPEPSRDGSAALLVLPQRILEEHRELLEASVRSVTRRFPRVHIEADLVRAEPAAALLQHAPGAAMLVIGTHRDGPLTGAYVGSVGRGLLWRARCPLVVVPSASFPAKGA